jgi:Flp pilus assembly protein TadG
VTSLRLLLRRQNGDAIIETAAVLPAFTLLLFGVFQFSLGLTRYLGAAYAIRAAARYASVRSNTSLAPASATDVQNFVKASPFVPSVAGTTIAVTYITTSGGGSTNVVGSGVYLTINYPQAISMPFYSHTFTINNVCLRYIVR